MIWDENKNTKQKKKSYKLVRTDKCDTILRTKKLSRKKIWKDIMRKTLNHVTEEILKEYCLLGYSTYKIMELTNSSYGGIRNKLKKFGLETQKIWNRSKSDLPSRKVPIETAREWSKIQTYYDSGKSWNDCIANKELNVNTVLISAARKAGVVKSRSNALTQSIKNMGSKHSEESKKKMSEIRKAYLSRENRPAWKTHNKFKSQPCEWLKSELEKRGYKFTPELSPLKYKGKFYSVDIAFLEQKFIIEINGRQHYNPDGTLTPYYQIRHDLIAADGWEIWEVAYTTTRNIGFLDLVLDTLKQKNIHPIE